MHLIIDTNGVAIRVRNGSFEVSGKEGKRRISPQLIRGISVFSDCLISSGALRLAIQERIPVFFFDEMGAALGRIWSAEFDHLPLIRRNQVLFETDRAAAAEWAAGLYRMKAESQIATLHFFEAKGSHTTKMQALSERFVAQARDGLPDFEEKIMQLEAQVAALYWDAVRDLLPAGYAFEKRSRQPAQDMFNAALNYFYGMLYNCVESAVFASGLDPFLGIVHADEYNKPTLVFDLIEPFRAWVDRLLVEMCRADRLQAHHFDLEKDAHRLNKAGKRVIIPAFESLLDTVQDWEGRSDTIKNHIYNFTGQFATFLSQYKQK